MKDGRGDNILRRQKHTRSQNKKKIAYPDCKVTPTYMSIQEKAPKRTLRYVSASST